MKYIITFILFFFFTLPLYAQSVFEYKYTSGYKAPDTEFALDYIKRTIKPKFPENTHINMQTIKLNKENFIVISFYYSEYDGATRGESKYFISFWKVYSDYIYCIGSNILDIYDPEVTYSNNIITIKGKNRYEPLNVYYYSFIYNNHTIYYNSILGILKDGDNNITSKYFFSPNNKKVNINSIFADYFIKDN